MTIRRLLARVQHWLQRQRPDPSAFVDVADRSRARVIAEADYQAAADAQSTVLRVSGKVPPPMRRVPAVVVRVRGRA